MSTDAGDILRPGRSRRELLHDACCGFGSLERMVARAPRLVPLPLVADGRPLQYMAHIGDLCRLVERACSPGAWPPDGPVTAAAAHPITLRAILETLARLHRTKPRFMPVPALLPRILLRSGELLGLKLSMRSDSLTSLMNPCAHPDFTALDRLGETFRAFDETTLRQQM